MRRTNKPRESRRPSGHVVRRAVLAGLALLPLAGCAAGDGAPLARDAMLAYRIDTFRIHQHPAFQSTTFADALTAELGQHWRYWLYGAAPLDVELHLYQYGRPQETPALPLIGSPLTTGREQVLWRMRPTDPADGRLLADFSRTTTLAFGSAVGRSGQELEAVLARRVRDHLKTLFHISRG